MASDSAFGDLKGSAGEWNASMPEPKAEEAQENALPRMDSEDEDKVVIPTRRGTVRSGNDMGGGEKMLTVPNNARPITAAEADMLFKIEMLPPN